ncbi:MAG: hypothetical protein LBE20_06820 [Deltaproteobacteria bacterium]|jgi:hypothetical protein|nr:hypothetical protein [Deltaproteobacteria bacterium]
MKINYHLSLGRILCISAALLGGIACSSDTQSTIPKVSMYIGTEDIEPNPPEGVVQYCWEEPLVIEQKVNAGVNTDGRWYLPAHKSINEVRMGRWRPCREMRSKAYGENELIPLD